MEQRELHQQLFQAVDVDNRIEEGFHGNQLSNAPLELGAVGEQSR